LESRVLPGFVAPLSYDAGGGPQAVAVADFNGDGLPDLAVANRSSNNVSVLLGNGDGTFQAARNFAAGTNPTAVAVGDFNGDGILDLAVANLDGVSVLLGNGDGSFQPARNFAAGRYPESVAVGDFNGDGRSDLAIANLGVSGQNGTISVLLGTGDGSFQPARNFPAGVGPQSVAVGDFNGDGLPDLAVANNSSNDVSVLLGNGDGSFQPAQTFAVGPRPSSVAVGDFNGDGFLDLVVAFTGPYPYTTGGVNILLGTGDGSFQPPQSFAAGTEPISVAVGDINGDGLLDLAVTNYQSSNNNVSVLLGTGDGNFQPARSFAAGTTPTSVAGGTSTATASPTWR
jgi:hypothetical protein